MYEMHFTPSRTRPPCIPEEINFCENKLFHICIASPIDINGETSEHVDINLYFTGMYDHGLGDKIKGFEICSALPWNELELNILNINSLPTPEGLVTPDVVVKCFSSKKLPNAIMVVFYLIIDEDFLSQKTIKERLLLSQTIQSNLLNIFRFNKVVIHESFLQSVKASLKSYQSQSDETRKVENIENAISLTTTSIREIVAASSSNLFRNTCFAMFEVANTNDLEIMLSQKLHAIIDVKADRGKKRARDEGAEEGSISSLDELSQHLI
uniref:uncharacterized protein LOC120335521 n=1 Tax=Styela clava TaxID=7725 RepID=UPI001939E1BB|nr:uncharacterized protein LOC120335521 [Styela clava]XP_039258969.1 uncharacterized protein LOC120335521 [Styela clava]XP_039258970.1 uncharacterized protein LOC120335521 [Styela clava]XP_039258971.1 uncharacterized protein LOC120335521 [Styela clava]